MKSYDQLRREFDHGSLRAEWAGILMTPAWQHVSEMLRVFFVEQSDAAINENDAIVARRLIKQNGGLAMLEALKNAANPPPKPPESEPEPWSHITTDQPKPNTNKP